MLRSARRREALWRPHREERGGGISWRPPAYSLFIHVTFSTSETAQRDTHTQTQVHTQQRPHRDSTCMSNIFRVAKKQTAFIFTTTSAKRTNFRNFSPLNSLRILSGFMNLSVHYARPASCGLLSRNRACTVIASRAFKHSSVFIWNSIPADIRICDSLYAFRRHLKTFLFNSAFAT